MNCPGSSNEQILGAMLVTSLFALWEERFRKEIGEELGEQALKFPIFGDLRLLRNCIVHHDGTWQPSLNRLEVLTIPESLVESEGGVLRLNKSRILDVWCGVHLALDDLLERK